MTRGKLAAFALLLAACTSEPTTQIEERTAIEHGKALFETRAASPSKLNDYSCSTCHVTTRATTDKAMYPGAPLAGATLRPTFWGGHELDLLASINHCRYWFMRAQQPWLATDVDAQAMYAYLASLPSALPEPQTFTVIPSVQDLAPTDAVRGAEVFALACRTCHGEVHTGKGRLSARMSILPEAPLAEHVEYTAAENRVIFIEKIRHGGFLGYGGAMPPFSVEVLSDADIQALLAYFEL